VGRVRKKFSRLHPAGSWRIPWCLLTLAVLCNGSDALARNARDVFNQFAGIPQPGVSKAVQAEWRRSPGAEITCVDQYLRPSGSGMSTLIERSIPPSGRVAPERASCEYQMAQSMLLTELTGVQTGPYGVEGLTLGSKVAFGTPAYRQYGCVLSQKFEGFVWCTKTVSDRERRGRFKESFSILHAQDGAVVYVNRYQEPAYWSANEVADDIQRYSRKIGEEPHIIQLPVLPGLPKGTLATWGKVVLEPIVGDELRLLGEDRPLKKGIAIDFIGNFSQSARRGLPIYRLAGGAGFVWAASYNQGGRGTLRFSAVDASMYSPQSLPPPATSPPPVAVDPPSAAETAVDAQPILSPVDATAPARRQGEQLDCIAGPDCDAPAPALSSAVAPPRGRNDVITQVLNFSTTQLQQTDPADGAGQYAREPAAPNFGSRKLEQGMLDLVVAYRVWLISALIALGPAGYWLIRLRIARGRGSADEARRAMEARAAEAARWVAEARAAEDAGRAAESQAAEGALRAVEASAAEEEEHLAVEAKDAEEAGRVAETQAAEDARRAVDASAAEDAGRAAQVQAAEDAPGVAIANAAEGTHRDAKARGNKEAGCVLKAKSIVKTKARGVTKAKAAEGTPRISKVKAVEEGRRAAEAKVARDAHRGAEAKVVEATRRVKEVKAAGGAGGVAEAKAAKGARRVARAKAVEEGRRAAEVSQPAKDGHIQQP
jgi:hypothetical protein